VLFRSIAQGRARVVKALENLKVMDEDTVLVCPSISRDLLPFLPGILALVTDTGGVLAPAATVAREYGIPTVVGTSCATDLINNGDIVRVDGTNGHVAIIAKSKQSARDDYLKDLSLHRFCVKMPQNGTGV